MTAIHTSSRHALMEAPLILEMREPRTFCGQAAHVGDCGLIASIEGPVPLADQQSGGSLLSGVQSGLAKYILQGWSATSATRKSSTMACCLPFATATSPIWTCWRRLPAASTR